MDYKIISFDASSGTIVVRYRDDMAPINIDLQLDENGLYITGTALEEYIRGFIPVWHLERLDRLAAGVPNASEIQALVQEEQTVQPQNTELTPEQIQNAKMWEQYEFEKQVGNALVKFGLAESNPATIPVAKL
jgi:hypothetical protein